MKMDDAELIMKFFSNQEVLDQLELSEVLQVQLAYVQMAERLQDVYAAVIKRKLHLSKDMFLYLPGKE